MATNKAKKKPVKAAKSVKKSVKPSAKKAMPKKAAKKPAPKTAAPKKAAPKKAMAKKAAPKKSAAVKKSAPAMKTKSQKTKAKATKIVRSPVVNLKPVAPRVERVKVMQDADWSKVFMPLDDRVLVLRHEALEKTPGGIYIPDSARESQNLGKVVATGRGRMSKKGRIRPMDVQVGDSVLFDKWAGVTLDLNGQSVVVLRENEILGVSRD